MTTRRATSGVSAAARLGLAAVLAAGAGGAACAGGPHPVTHWADMERTDGTGNTGESEAQPVTIEFDNEATVHVDVYLVTGQYQWRLRRVEPGTRALLRVPQSVIESTIGFVRLTVLPGSQISAEAALDPRAVVAIAQPVSELLSHRWTFRPSATASMQLQGTRVRSTNPRS
jgi:hypothetical protein